MEFNQPGEKSKYSGYFINDRKYLVGDQIRLRFQFDKPNEIWTKVTEKLLKEDPTLYKDKVRGNVFQNKTLVKNKEGVSIGDSWFSDLIVVPRFLRKHDFLI